MPLTFTPDETEERKRKSAAALATGGQQAIGYGMDALSTMEALAKQKRAEERQAGLDNDARAENAERLRLLRAADARAAGADARATEMHGLTLEQKRAEERRTEEDRKRTADADALKLEDGRKKAARAQIAAIVKAARDEGLDDQAMIERASGTPGMEEAGINWQEIVAERRAQEEADRVERLDRRKTESEIAENEAQAKRAARVGGPKVKTPEQIALEDARRRKAIADAKIAEDKANAPAGSNFTTDPVTVRKLQADRVLVAKAQKSAQAIRALTQKYNLEDYVGPVDGIKMFLKGKLGMNDQTASQIESTIRRAFTDYKVAATGAAAGVKEMADIQATVPSTFDSLDQVLGKLQAGEDIANSVLGSIDAVLSTGDVRASSGDVPAGAPVAAAPAGDFVVVTNGTETMRIPRGDLAEAQAEGFEVAK